MTTYNTGNPLGSVDVRDLYDNAENLDNLANGPAVEYDDRLGVPRKSWAGMEADFAAFLIASGYEFIGDYDTDGPLLIERPNQVFTKDGEYWRSGPSLTLPYTTVDNWVTDQPKFVTVGDAILRQELESDEGLGGELNRGEKTLTVEPRRFTDRAIVSFIFDDAYDGAYTVVAPLFVSKGFRAGFAINAKSPALGLAGATNFEQLLEMQRLGHEIINHGATHENLSAGTENTYLAQSEIEEARRDLVRLGFDIQTYVAANSTLADVHIDKYLRPSHCSGFTVFNDTTGIGALQADNLDPFKLKRLSLYSAGLVAAKATVDAAIANKGWVCFYDHDPLQVGFPNSMSLADLTDLLDYCVAQGVDVMVPRNALDAIYSGVIKSRRLDLIERRGDRFQHGNFCVDAEFTSFSSSSASAWTLANNGADGTATPTAKLGSGVYHYRQITLAGNTADVGEFVLTNDLARLTPAGARMGRMTFAMDLFSSSASVNTNFDVTLGIQARRVSDNVAIAGSETTKLYLDQYARRYYASIAIERPGEAVYFRVFLRFTPKVTAAAAVISLGNPAISEGGQPAYWAPGLPMPTSAEAKMAFPLLAVSAGVRTKIPMDPPTTSRRFLSVSGGTATIRESGLYAVHAFLKVDGTTDVSGARGIMSIRLNGVATEINEQESTGGPLRGSNYRLILANNSHIYLNEGDTLEFWAFSSVAVTFPLAPTYSYALISKIGQ